jgi:steroid delta-isomerase-like uncharacterized protein
MAKPKTGDGAETKAKPRRNAKRKVVEAHVTSYFEALDRRDVRAIGEHWAEDGVEELVPIGVLRGREEITSFFRDVFAAMPDASTSLIRIVPGDRLAAAEWRMQGNFTGEPFQGIDPTGKPVEIRGLDLLEVENERIVSNTAYYDGAAFARQVGLLPGQDSGAERAMKSAFNTVTRVRKAIAERGPRYEW